MKSILTFDIASSFESSHIMLAAADNSASANGTVKMIDRKLERTKDTKAAWMWHFVFTPLLRAEISCVPPNDVTQAAITSHCC